MNKMKIDFEPVKNKVIRFGKNKIEIKPFLSIEDISELISVCDIQYETNRENIAMVKMVFDIVVIDKTTNIEIEGVGIKESKGKRQLTVNVNENEIKKFDSSRIIDTIKNNISNYEDAWIQVLKNIEFNNMYYALTSITSNLPNIDDVNKSLDATFKALSEFKEKNPEGFDRAIKDSIAKRTIEETKKEKSKIKKER